MKNKAKIKNLFIVVMLCLISVVPIFSSSINVKADTEQIPIFDIEPTMFYVENEDWEEWFLLIDKDFYEQYSENIQICANMIYVGYDCLYINDAYDYLVYEEWIAPNEWWSYIDFSSYDFLSFEHYKSKYYLIPISSYLSLDWGVTIHSLYGVDLIIISGGYHSYRNVKHTLSSDIVNFYDKKIMPLVDIYNDGYNNGYDKGVIAGKNEAFENYDNLLPTVFGSIAMFFIGIFGSVEVFGMTLLTIFGIIGSLLLIWYVLRLVIG